MEATWMKLMESGMNSVLVASYQAAILAMIVLIITWLGRDRIRANWRFALWLIVFARLATPWIPQSPTSLYSFLPQWSQPSRSVQPTTPVPRPIPAPTAGEIQPKLTHIGLAARPTLTRGVSEPAMTTIGSPFGEMPPIEPKQPTRTPWTIAQYAVLIWLTGTVLLLLRLMRLHIRLFIACRGWQPVDEGGLITLFEECKTESHVRGCVSLRICEQNIGPATFGVFRPSIVLPRRITLELSRDQLRLVLLHELMHVRRRDALIDLFATVVSAIHWFNPIAWFALSRLHQERELACDDALLDLTNEDQRQSYGTTLLRAAELLRPVTAVSGAISMLAGRSTAHGLDDRIRSIARHRRSSRMSIVAGATAVLGILAIGMTDRIASSNEREATATQAKNTITVEGQCRDENGQTLLGVKVRLFRDDQASLQKPELVREATTDAEGRYRFPEVTVPEAHQRPAINHTIVCTLEGRASWMMPIQQFDRDHQQQVILPLAAEIKGRVIDSEGNPIAGAWVWSQGLSGGPLEGVMSAQTDADGRYRIRDFHQFVPSVLELKSGLGRGTTLTETGFSIFASHPDHVKSTGMSRRSPGTVDFKLSEGGVIEGQVVDSVTGKPGARVLVNFVPLQRGGNASSEQVLTDQYGRYRSPILSGTEFAIWADVPDRVCLPIKSLAVKTGQTIQAPEIPLIEGGWIEGQVLVDDQKLTRDVRTGSPLTVSCRNPSRPRIPDLGDMRQVDDEGRFRFRVAPGLSVIHVRSANNWLWERVQDRQKFDDGIEVKAGETVQVVVRVKNDRQMARQSSDRVSLPLPVPAEITAADAIRDCGGWYELNDAGHIVEVNMVYVEKGDKRYDNSFSLPEFLPHLASLPFVERLYLKEGQLDDEGMKFIGQLEQLQTLMIWDGKAISDDGIAHLRHLQKLKMIHLTQSQMTDQAIAYLAEIPTLEELSIEENYFTDKAFEYAALLPRLKNLYIDSGPSFSNEGFASLGTITTLERLSLNNARLTPQSLRMLMRLDNLEVLQLGQTDLPEETIRTFQSGHPKLKVTTSDRIFASAIEIQAAKDPKQQQLNRMEAAAGLAVVEKFLGLMSTGKTADAGQFYHPDLVSFLRPRLSDDEWSWIKIARVFGDREAVLVVTTAKNHDQSFRIDENGRAQRVTTFLFIVAAKEEGRWRIRECDFDNESDARHVRYFLSEHVGAQELVPSPEWLTDKWFGTPIPMKR